MYKKNSSGDNSKLQACTHTNQPGDNLPHGWATPNFDSSSRRELTTSFSAHLDTLSPRQLIRERSFSIPSLDLALFCGTQTQLQCYPTSPSTNRPCVLPGRPTIALPRCPPHLNHKSLGKKKRTVLWQSYQANLENFWLPSCL